MLDENKYSELIENYLKGLIPDIAKSQEDKGLKASGKSAASLRVEMVDTLTGQLIDGSGAFRFQDEPGRGPTNGGAGNPTVRQLIYEWLAYKKYGIDYLNDKERISLSWAISNKIHKEGNFIRINRRRTNVLSDVINASRKQSFVDQIKDLVTIDFKTDLVDSLNNL